MASIGTITPEDTTIIAIEDMAKESIKAPLVAAMLTNSASISNPTRLELHVRIILLVNCLQNSKYYTHVTRPIIKKTLIMFILINISNFLQDENRIQIQSAAVKKHLCRQIIGSSAISSMAMIVVSLGASRDCTGKSHQKCCRLVGSSSSHKFHIPSGATDTYSFTWNKTWSNCNHELTTQKFQHSLFIWSKLIKTFIIIFII